MASQTMRMTNTITRILIPRSFQRRLLVTPRPCLSLSIGFYKLITYASYGQNILWIRWIFFNLLPEFSNMDINDTVNHGGLMSRIDMGQKLITGKDFSWRI